MSRHYRHAPVLSWAPGYSQGLEITVAVADGVPLGLEERLKLAGLVRGCHEDLTHIQSSGEAYGAKLTVIHGERLYRESGTWAQFMHATFRRSGKSGYNWMRVARVTANLIADLSTLFPADLHLTQHQANELATLPDVAQSTAYRIASAAGPADQETIDAAVEQVNRILEGRPLTAQELGDLQAVQDLLAAGRGAGGTVQRRNRRPDEIFTDLVEKVGKKAKRLPAEAAAVVLMRALETLIERDPVAVGLTLIGALARVNDRLPSPVVAAKAKLVLPRYAACLREAAGHC